ncbi:MAG: type II toxin-antitoxin system VapC family toxin [Euzebya sp.]
MTFLVDTFVISELRKGNRANRGVRQWMRDSGDSLFLSVLVVGELRRGITQVARRDPGAAHHLTLWLEGIIDRYAARILPVTLEIAQVWGGLGVPDPVPAVDGLLAATALVHDLTLVTRNVSDVESTGVPLLDPFQWAGT